MRLRAFTTVAASAALALSLSACVSPSLVTGNAKPTRGAIKAQSDAELAMLKEVNRHLELCDRTYGWPFTAVITCSHQQAAPTISDEQLAKIVAAVKAQLAAPATPPSP